MIRYTRACILVSHLSPPTTSTCRTAIAERESRSGRTLQRSISLNAHTASSSTVARIVMSVTRLVMTRMNKMDGRTWLQFAVSASHFPRFLVQRSSDSYIAWMELSTSVVHLRLCARRLTINHHHRQHRSAGFLRRVWNVDELYRRMGAKLRIPAAELLQVAIALSILAVSCLSALSADVEISSRKQRCTIACQTHSHQVGLLR